MKPVSIDKNQRRIREMFDGIAATYDFLNHFLSAGLDLWWRRCAARILAPAPRSRLLDVATGTGDLAFAALAREPSLHIIGVDLAPEMLKRAMAKAEARRIVDGRYRVLAGDALHLPCRDGSFDAVTIAYGIRNVPDMGAALQEFHRVLKSGGRLLILEFSLPTHPLFRWFYLFYFETVLPAVGRWISQDREAYEYLPASVGAFVSPDAMEAIVHRSGFRPESVTPLLGGVTYVLTALKP